MPHQSHRGPQVLILGIWWELAPEIQILEETNRDLQNSEHLIRASVMHPTQVHDLGALR